MKRARWTITHSLAVLPAFERSCLVGGSAATGVLFVHLNRTVGSTSHETPLLLPRPNFFRRVGHYQEGHEDASVSYTTGCGESDGHQAPAEKNVQFFGSTFLPAILPETKMAHLPVMTLPYPVKNPERYSRLLTSTFFDLFHHVRHIYYAFT